MIPNTFSFIENYSCSLYYYYTKDKEVDFNVAYHLKSFKKFL